MPDKNNASATAREGGAAPSFEGLGLSDHALKAVARLGYALPTPVQAKAIPEVLAGRDVMAAAQTGTGKTAAFLLPTLDALPHARRGQGPLMLVLTPTRELAQQIEDVATTVCAETHHRVTVVVGGLSYEPQRQALKRGVDLLVATPGRLIDLIEQGVCDLSRVEVLVLDEADRMLDMGFLPDMRKIVARCPDERQTLLFSATLDDHVLDNTKALVRDPARIEIAPKGSAAETVEQYVLGTSRDAKKRLLRQILKREGSKRVIVFTNGKHRADFICRKLRQDGVSCAPIHGNRSQNQRARALQQFADGEVDVLVATDVLARGIDVPDVSYVINLDVPTDDPESYIHRIGRTGRAGEAGWALTFVTEEDYLDLRDVEKLMGKVIPPFPRTDGLDLGEDPFVPDPRRNPREKLPSKRARKQMAKRREQQRASESATRTVGGKRESTPKERKRTPADARRATEGNATPKRSSDARRSQGRRGQSQRRQRPAGTAQPKAPSASRQKHRRHPGDHGGRQ